MKLIVIMILCCILTQTGGKREISLQQIQNSDGNNVHNQYLNQNLDANFYRARPAVTSLF